MARARLALLNQQHQARAPHRTDIMGNGMNKVRNCSDWANFYISIDILVV